LSSPARNGRPPMHRVSSDRRSVARLILAIAAASGCALGFALPSHAQDAYVSDRLAVPLYGAPSDQARMVDRALPGGSRITLLEPAATGAFTRVRTETGLEGWLAASVISTEPPARERLAAAEAEVERLSATVVELRGAIQRLQSGGAAPLPAGAGTAPQAGLEVGPPDLASSIESLRAELAGLRRSAGNSSGVETANQRLTELNAQLRQEVESLALELQVIRDEASRTSLLWGAGLILLGLIIGLLVKARPRRSAWS